jgi:type IV secretory pathway TraG/TraD family ATPase VirD4
MVEKYVLNKKHLSESKEISIRTEPLNFTKTFLVLGSMGSGKTEFFHSILNQHKFNRNIIHDIKGDFVQKWYNPKTDFIFNPYDERGINWDLWQELKESPALVESFIGNLMESQTEEKDFFTASAKKVIIDFFMKINYQCSDKTSAEKWVYLNKEIEAYKEDSESNKTKSSIYQTMDLVIELFSYMAWHSEQGKQSFTINKFLKGHGTLFLLNNSSVATKLTPLFTGFLSLFTEILLSQSDTKENLTLILLDEYLSMSFEKQTRLKLLTQIRSKGGCLMLGMQYLPKHDMEHQQLLDSSSYAKLIFQISDNETINHIIDNISDITYVSLSEGSSKSNVGIMDSLVSKESASNGTSTNKSENTKKLLSSSHLQSMPAYSHLSIISSEKILYLGYTEMVKNLIAKNNHFEPINQNDYYRTKYSDSKVTTSKDEDRLKDINDEIKQLERELQK